MMLKSAIVLLALGLCGCHAQVIGFNASNYTISESDKTLEVKAMILEGYIPEGETATVTVSTQDGSAEGGKDYKEINEEILTFDNESMAQTITITVFEDKLEEEEESFSLILTKRQGIVKRFTLSVRTSIASIIINDTSTMDGKILAIGLGVGIGLIGLALGITTPIVIAVVVVIKLKKNKSKVYPFK